MQKITKLPTPPSSKDTLNFSERADAFLLALLPFCDELNRLAADLDIKSAEIGMKVDTAKTAMQEVFDTFKSSKLDELTLESNSIIAQTKQTIATMLGQEIFKSEVVLKSDLVENIIQVADDGIIDISKGSYFRLDMTKSMALQLKNEPSFSAQPVYSFVLEILNGDRYALTWFDGISWSKGLLPSFENNRRSLFAFIVTDSIIGINVSKELDTKPRLRKEKA